MSKGYDKLPDEDAYGEPLKYIKAKKLATTLLKYKQNNNLSMHNNAILSFLAFSHPDTLIALYWH